MSDSPSPQTPGTTPIPSSATLRVTRTPGGQVVATAHGVAGSGGTPEEAVADLQAKLSADLPGGGKAGPGG